MIKIYLKYLEIALLIISSVITDIKLYKIKNFIIFPFILIGIVSNCIEVGLVNGLIQALLGIIVPFLCLIILFAAKMLGAGDIKLFCAIGSIMGYKFVVLNMIISFLFGGVLGIIFMLLRKNVKERFLYFFQYIKNCIILMQLLKYDETDNISSHHFRFSYAILGGTIIQSLL